MFCPPSNIYNLQERVSNLNLYHTKKGSDNICFSRHQIRPTRKTSIISEDESALGGF